MEQVDVILAKHESKHTQSCVQILLMKVLSISKFSVYCRSGNFRVAFFFFA